MTPKIAFIGAGSTVFMKNIIGDCLHFPRLSSAQFALMDIDPMRLEDSRLVATKMIDAMGAKAQVATYRSQRAALEGADFVIVAFQIGGYKPCTTTDFDLPKSYGLDQTIADTLGIGGIMRGLRTVPHLWSVCEDMRAVCPDATLLQYVNPMAINTWAISARFPDIKQVGLCHSVQGTAEELARDLDLAVEDLRYRAAGINHMAFYLELAAKQKDGSYGDLYPALQQGYHTGHLPTTTGNNPRCHNYVRYEVMKQFGYFVTESSEHFAEYVPWFIKSHRPDLIDTFKIPLDEYPKRCEEQITDWGQQARTYRNAAQIEVTQSHEYAAQIMNALQGGTACTIYGNVANNGLIPQLPESAAVEVACHVDSTGLNPEPVHDIPPQLVAMMRTNVNVQELTVQALLTENRDHIYHAAMLDPRTAAELDLGQIRRLVDDLLTAHDDWLPNWINTATAA
jgi:alpha-galactosidase